MILRDRTLIFSLMKGILTILVIAGLWLETTAQNSTVGFELDALP